MFKNTISGVKKDYKVMCAKLQNKVISVYIKSFMSYQKQGLAKTDDYKNFYDVTVLFAKNNAIIKQDGGI